MIKKVLHNKKFWIASSILVFAGIRHLYKKRNRKIFVSYHSKNDARYKNMLSAWNNNQEFEFSFDDKSVGISINSTDDSRIKAGITRKLNKSNLVLCIVGEETHKRTNGKLGTSKSKRIK